MDLSVLYWILIAVMLVGVVGAALPGIPGPGLILVAVLVWCFATGFSNIGVPIIAVFAVLLLSTGVEILSAYLGAKQFGASNWGQVGAIAGLILGVFGLLPALPVGGPIVGLLIGPVIGAFVGEFLYRRKLELGDRIVQSIKASFGIIVGSLVGKVIEFVLAIVAVVVFVWGTWPQVFPG